MLAYTPGKPETRRCIYKRSYILANDHVPTNAVYYFEQVYRPLILAEDYWRESRSGYTDGQVVDYY